MNSSIIIKLFIEGIHRWENCDIEEVSFLRNYHRHVFHITCEKQVSHLDRDIEIIKLKRAVEGYLKDRFFDEGRNCCFFDSKSCEMIADELVGAFRLNRCEVLEDGENGAAISNDS